MKADGQNALHETVSFKFRDLGIDAYQNHVVFMPEDTAVCKSSGSPGMTTVCVRRNGVTINAAIHTTSSCLLHQGEISLSKAAMQKLNVQDNDLLEVISYEPMQSLAKVRAKLYGNRLKPAEYDHIVEDIANERYSEACLSSFIAACAATNMKLEEVCYLTMAMIKTGNKLAWGNHIIANNHNVGNMPGNPTVMLVVPIIASLGIRLPAIYSRAFSSPYSTAHSMEVLTNVHLCHDHLSAVVEMENGCITWGCPRKLSPAAEIIDKVKDALDIDCEGLMIASVVSKNIAAGVTDCVIEIPVGRYERVRTVDEAISLTLRFNKVAEYVGLNLQTICTNGAQPVSWGMGPSLEARDVLAVLNNTPEASQRLRERAVSLATEIVMLVTTNEKSVAKDLVIKQIDSGQAFSQLIRICEAQGRFTEPKQARFCKTIEASGSGAVAEINTRCLAKIVALAGAPYAKEAGLASMVQVNEQIRKGQPIFTIHANSLKELESAHAYWQQYEKKIIRLSHDSIKV